MRAQTDRDDGSSVEPIAEGDQIGVWPATLMVVHTPGHTRGHVVFSIDTNGCREILSGDALLPNNTPKMGGADIRVDRPLERSLETLLQILSSRYSRAWLDHRRPNDDTRGRAGDIIVTTTPVPSRLCSHSNKWVRRRSGR
jgi:glyoxylase-like metal-dependent hydrolase (beta-lactamase superfamily II)